MMRRSVCPIAALLCVSMQSLAATVVYQHPDLSIAAKDEPLQSVLKSVGKEMRIFVTTPTGLDPVVNCDIQGQPIKLALKHLLGDMSYTLEWDETTGQLVGLTVLGAGSSDTSAVPSTPTSGTPSDVGQVLSVPDNSAAPTTAVRNEQVATQSGQGQSRAELEAQEEADRVRMEHVARIEAEQALREAEMDIRGEEAEIARRERWVEEVARHDAEAAAYLESQGLSTQNR